MVEANYLPLGWARDVKQSGSVWQGEDVAFQEGYILGFMNRDDADRVTRQYVENVMKARARGVSA